jgi:hypothetical protein
MTFYEFIFFVPVHFRMDAFWQPKGGSMSDSVRIFGKPT